MSEAVNKFFEDFMDWRLQDTPEFATCIGINDFDDKLELYSIEGFASRKESCLQFLKQAEELKLTATGDDIENLQLFQFELNQVVGGHEFIWHAAPINYFEGPQCEINQIISYMKKETIEDFRKIINRYHAFSEQANQMIDMMNLGIKQDSTNHVTSMASVLDQLQAILKQDIDSSDFFAPFKSMPSTISAENIKTLQKEAKESIIGFLLPSFQKIFNFLQVDYIPKTRLNISATSLPNGKKFYEKCMKFHLSCDMTAEEVHDIGLKEVNRISQEMATIIAELGFDMSVQQFSDKIRGDPQFFYTSKSELKKDYENIVFNEIYPALEKIFGTSSIPKAKLKIESLPESQAQGPAAFYLAGSFDGKRPGTFYVNDWNLKESPKYEMMSLALHEALPGHHLQSSFMIERENVPRFRQIHEDRKYFSVPGRFAMYSAYGEGWGLYSEYLGNELGLYKNPYSHFGQLSQEIFRSCRLVVDTGIHYFGWSQEQAVKYMLDHSASPKLNIEKEVKRYIMWPAQACAYKIGELKIKELRKKAEEKLKDKFDLKRFHHIILLSVGPLSFLQDKVNEYINSEGL